MDYEEKYKLIQRVITNCAAEIDVIALGEDNRFVGKESGKLKVFVLSRYCNKKYTWSSSAGSILDKETVPRVPEGYHFVEDVIGGQLEMEFSL